MLGHRRISLNAVRIFVLAAHHSSLAQAAAALGLTAGAVSHQIKNLEASLGVALFERRSNSVVLTDAGTHFYAEASTAVALMERAAEAVYRDANQITVEVSMSLAVRWLIPALERYRALHPAVAVRIETNVEASFSIGSTADLAIIYHRATSHDPVGERLVGDFSRPVAAPALLKSVGYRGPADIGAVPALQCTRNNWDWGLWADHAGIDVASLRLRHAFDTDDAALHAAVAGMGMVLATPLLVEKEIRSGALIYVPDLPAVELGEYRILTRPHESRAARQFRSWLNAEMARSIG